MRVSATALRKSNADAVGALELECTLAGLRVDLHGLAAAQNGFAPGGFVSGARVIIPYAEIQSAVSHEDALQIELDCPRLPFRRLVLSHFTAEAAAHPIELRKRRLVLHLSALAVALITGTGYASVFASQPGRAGLTALLSGLGLFCLIILVAYGVDQRFFLRPTTPLEARLGFESELAKYFPSLAASQVKLSSSKQEFDLPRLLESFPRSIGALIIVVNALSLTLIFSADYLGSTQTASQSLSALTTSEAQENQDIIAALQPVPNPEPAPPASPRLKPETQKTTPAAIKIVEQEPLERPASTKPCTCERADSKLWQAAPPKLSAVLIEKKVLPRKKFLKLGLELAVVNNSDTPMSQVTLHVQFYEQRGKDRRAMKERPLYFEGPLRPGRAIKWSVEARGTDYEIRLPDYGDLGSDGDEAASEANFTRLLEARHRPVRLHAARMLAYLGAPGAREAALKLKDALRAAEGPYLRRVLAASHSVRLCDVQFLDEVTGGVRACIYNASDAPRADLGVLMSRLSKPLDVRQPLADPPKIIASQRLALSGNYPPHSGQVVGLTLNQELQKGLDVKAREEQIELEADQFDLLE